MKQCKIHKWRIGSGIGKITGYRISNIGLNIWCEKCGKKIKAYYFTYKNGAKSK